MKRLFLICFFVFLTGELIWQSTYADQITTEEETVVVFSGDNTKPEDIEPVTIKQMKENLEDLKDRKENIGDKWETLRIVNGKVIDFLKNDLSDTDIWVIQDLSIGFQQRKTFYEQQLKDNSLENYDTSVEQDNDTAAVKQNFIDYKLNFYKQLVPYINSQKKDEYLDYIKGNIEIEKEDKDIKEKIYKQEWVIEERVGTLKEKIIEHKKALEEKLEKLIRQKIEEKIRTILSSEKMLKMSNTQKISLLQKVVERFEERKTKLLNDSEDSEYLRKKVEIYDIAVDIVKVEISLIQ